MRRCPMELSHDWIEEGAAGKSGIECADSSGQIERFEFHTNDARTVQEKND